MSKAPRLHEVEHCTYIPIYTPPRRCCLTNLWQECTNAADSMAFPLAGGAYAHINRAHISYTSHSAISMQTFTYFSNRFYLTPKLSRVRPFSKLPVDLRERAPGAYGRTALCSTGIPASQWREWSSLYMWVDNRPDYSKTFFPKAFLIRWLNVSASSSPTNGYMYIPELHNVVASSLGLEDER